MLRGMSQRQQAAQVPCVRSNHARVSSRSSLLRPKHSCTCAIFYGAVFGCLVLTLIAAQNRMQVTPPARSAQRCACSSWAREPHRAATPCSAAPNSRSLFYSLLFVLPAIRVCSEISTLMLASALQRSKPGATL